MPPRLLAESHHNAKHTNIFSRTFCAPSFFGVPSKPLEGETAFIEVPAIGINTFLKSLFHLIPDFFKISFPQPPEQPL